MSRKEAVLTTVRARCIVESGKTIEAPILFSSSPIAFLQGVDPEKGTVSDKKSEIFGRKFQGKILVFPNAVGSSVGAYVIYRMGKNHTAPLAMINETSDIITASGCALAGIPLYDVQGQSLEIFRMLHKIAIKGKSGIISTRI
jgi:predicted aconitase with swiveling domain